MLTWESSSYGDTWAENYDARFAGLTDTAPAVAVLTELAAGGPVLELGPGTGRLAIPLSEACQEVHGVEASTKMIEKLRSKPGGCAVHLTQASFEDYQLERDFSLIFTSCNTLFDLPTQAAQLSCIRTAARHLRPGGCLAVEASVPWHLVPTPEVSPTILALGENSVVLQAVTHDQAQQQLFKQRITVTDDGIRFGPVRNRYIWPSELDLMARLGGLQLQQRWSGWERGPFTSASSGHISIYRPSI